MAAGVREFRHCIPEMYLEQIRKKYLAYIQVQGSKRSNVLFKNEPETCVKSKSQKVGESFLTFSFIREFNIK